MKERPILFSGPMVRAILDGRKTQSEAEADARYFDNADMMGAREAAFEEAARIVEDFTADKGVVTFNEIAHEIRAAIQRERQQGAGDAD